VHTDVTLRRVQRFRPKPGERLRAEVGRGNTTDIRVDAQGRITVAAVVIPGPDGVRLTLRRN
jgi:hypothetical protein